VSRAVLLHSWPIGKIHLQKRVRLPDADVHIGTGEVSADQVELVATFLWTIRGAFDDERDEIRSRRINLTGCRPRLD
jgi:hypothetical protein